ncbi:Golgi to ER traffic protein 4 homolog [Carlito syrichta]|uniref:Golgi to ER traffic protein 4 homolog n=1 Tax=Carlito syrichta TaxID=1868482 RepID=A0A1U7SLT1_CARSF|nr:Golgi to ER traffic protein 4 homolog [Carlito syrichta]
MSQSKHVEARELMYSGALLFFSHGQQNSAADLSMLVLEALEKAEVAVAEDLLENLAKVFSLMDPNSPERVAFVSRALKWSSGGSGKLGHPRLHQLLALTLWKEQNYCESRYHFLHSSDGEGCANMLVEYSTSRGFRSEVDMFVAQAVLQFLCLKNKSSASVVFTTYTQKHPSIEDGPPFVEPLLNFLWFLLLAVDGGKLAVFTVLCEQYQPALRRDPMYNEYLDRIGQLFFGVPPKQTSSYGGLLGNLLSSLMGSSEQEEGDENPDDTPALLRPPLPVLCLWVRGGCGRHRRPVLRDRARRPWSVQRRGGGGPSDRRALPGRVAFARERLSGVSWLSAERRVTLQPPQACPVTDGARAPGASSLTFHECGTQGRGRGSPAGPGPLCPVLQPGAALEMPW